MSRKLQVFLCHASEDKPIVQELYERLKSEEWVDPWLDSEKILAGQNWDLEIEKAIQNADVIIVCLSKIAISKEGYIQTEIKRALKISEEKPDGVIHLIPLKFDNCDMPRALAKWQWVSYYQNESYKNLLKSLKERMTQIEDRLHRKSDFEFVCDFCEKIIDINNEGGKIFIVRDDVSKARKISKEMEEQDSLADIDFLSATAYWHISHYGCGGNEYPEYQIDISRIKTLKQVVEWTRHLMEKNWLTYTNWHHFIFSLAEQIEE